MRQLLMGDLIAASRAVLVLPPDQRRQAIAKMLYHAHSADKFVKQTQKLHPQWGNGSLMAAAARPPGPEPFAGELAYLDALHDVLGQIICWKRRLVAPS
jgi:hypothetical protein